MNSYQLRQLDDDGQVISERRVEADDYSAALRQLKEVFGDAQRIQIYNEQDEKAGEISVDYWRREVRWR